MADETTVVFGALVRLAELLRSTEGKVKLTTTRERAKIPAFPDNAAPVRP
jgi:hypothetical protein